MPSIFAKVFLKLKNFCENEDSEAISEIDKFFVILLLVRTIIPMRAITHILKELNI